MNYNYNYGGGYNQPYMQQEIVTVETYQNPRPYYNQPMIVQPSPQVIVVDNNRYGNNMASNEAALCAWCCCL